MLTALYSLYCAITKLATPDNIALIQKLAADIEASVEALESLKSNMPVSKS